jgi:hypothetical protein
MHETEEKTLNTLVPLGLIHTFQAPPRLVQFRAGVREGFSTVAPAAKGRSSGSGDGVEIGTRKQQVVPALHPRTPHHRDDVEKTARELVKQIVEYDLGVVRDLKAASRTDHKW